MISPRDNEGYDPADDQDVSIEEMLDCDYEPVPMPPGMAALDAEQVRLAFEDTEKEQPINFWACFTDRLNAALTSQNKRIDK